MPPTQPTNEAAFSLKKSYLQAPKFGILPFRDLLSKTDLDSIRFVSKYHRAVCFYYLSIQGISALYAKPESNTDVNVNAGGSVPGRNQITCQVVSKLRMASKHSTY